MKSEKSAKIVKVKYALEIYSEDDKKTLSTLKNLDSLPRFEVGDHVDEWFFNRTCDVGWRAIVTDVVYFWPGTTAKPELMLKLKIRSGNGNEQSERLKKHDLSEH
jgi:hypothetical protein